jgi:hypothetical protein
MSWTDNSNQSNTSRSLILVVDVLLEIGRRQEVVRREAVHVEVGLLHRPRLLQLPLVVDGALAVAEEGDGGVAAVRDVDAVDVAVVGDDGLHAGLPEDVLAAAGALAGLHAEQVRVLELDEQPRALAEVAPHRVVDDVERRRAPRPQRHRAGLQLQDEAFLAVEDLLADAHRVREEVGDRARIQALQRGGKEHDRRCIWPNANAWLHVPGCFVYLEGAAEGAWRAAGGVGLLGGGLAPRDLAVAAGAHLVAGHDELEEPDLGGLLPEHEAADLGAALRGGDGLVAEVELGRAHPHLAHGVHAAHPLQRRLPARRRNVLLDDVLGRRRLLQLIVHATGSILQDSGRARARVTKTKRARYRRWAAYDGGVADGAAEGAVVRDGAGDERRADDVEEELELGGRGGGPVDGGSVEGLVLEPGAHVGAPCAAALVGAGGVDEHLIGDGHLQHGVQGVVAVQVRAQLPHDTAAASPRRASMPTDGRVEQAELS